MSYVELWPTLMTSFQFDYFYKDRREAEDIKKRWQEYTEELYKKRS